MQRFEHGPLLTKAMIDFFFAQYVRTPADRDDWRFAPLLADDVDGVAPAWIGLAECDPVVDEGIAYADKLRAAGVPVDLEIYRGVIHEFIKMGRAIAGSAAGARRRGPRTQGSTDTMSDTCHPTTGFPLFPPPARALGRSGHAEDRLQRALPDVLRHRRRRLLARAGAAVRGGDASLGGDLYVRKATIDFRASARMDDMLDVGMKCARIGNSSMVFEGALFRQDQYLVGCELVYVFADPATQTSKPVPLLRDVLTGYEAGEPMRTVETGDWDTLGEGAGALRRAVFIEEQNIPESLEWDAHDAVVLHAVARNRSGRSLPPGGCCMPKTASPHRPHGGAPHAAQRRAWRGRDAGARRSGAGARRPRSGAERAAQCRAVLCAAGLCGARRAVRGSRHPARRDAARLALSRDGLFTSSPSSITRRAGPARSPGPTRGTATGRPNLDAASAACGGTGITPAATRFSRLS
jgi:acyl-CoA thioesterase FadM